MDKLESDDISFLAKAYNWTVAGFIEESPETIILSLRMTAATASSS